MLNIETLASMSAKQQKEVVASVDASHASRSLRRRFTKIQKKQGGFTLLELLVVISIIAVLGGLAIGAFGDKTAKAAKASATNTMAALQSTVQAFQATAGVLPNNLDTLVCADATATLTNAAVYGGSSDLPGVGGGMGAKLKGKLSVLPLPDGMRDGLVASGIDTLRYGLTGTCNTVAGAAIGAPGAVAGIDFGAGFNTPSPTAYPGGALVNVDIPVRGFDFPVAGGSNRGRAFAAKVSDGAFATTEVPLQVWQRGSNGANNLKLGAGKDDVLVALGLGNNSTIVTDPNNSALASTAFYADVGRDKYARYLLLVKVGTGVPALPTDAAWTTTGLAAVGATANSKAKFITVIDPRGDFLDEEFAESTGQKL